MRKNTKLFFTFFVLLISYFGFINQANALSKAWDFSVSTEYTLSDITLLEVIGGVAKLKMLLSHEGSITDGTNGAILDQIQGIEIVGNYAYLTSRAGNALEIIDISNPANPIHISNISTLKEPQDLVVDGDYAYITSYKNDAIQIIDISDPANPSIVSSLGKSNTIKLNGAIGIEKVGNYLYVVSDMDDALEIIYVADPANPSHVGELSDGTRLNGAEDIKISGNYAYVTAKTNDSLEVIDISDPTNPVFVGQLTDGTGGATLNGASGLAINGTYLLVAANIADAIEIIDISNPTTPVHVSSIANGGTTLLNGPENIIIDGDYAYIASNTSDAIEIIANGYGVNPSHSTSIINGGTTLLNGAKDLEKIGDYIYVASDISDALEIIKISYTATNPHIISTSSLVYSGSIDQITTTYTAGNEGNVTYQISKDNGATWYYLIGTTRIATTAGVLESNTPIEINSEIQTFNGLAGGTGEFLFKAFLTGDGTQKVELDNVEIGYTSAGINEILDFELPGGYTVTSGTWSRTTNNPYEGAYSLESGNHTKDTISCFEVTRDVFKDSTISFYREVSSEITYDFLNFSIDGVEQNQWSGEVSWGQEVYNITNGSHTFEWCYEKDINGDTGLDTAWIDYIEITEIPPVEEVIVLDFEVAGGYTVTTTVTDPGPDWLRVTTEKYEESYSIESQNRTASTSSCFERVQTVDIIDTGISFYRKISSELSDYLIFSIDGVEQDRWSGEFGRDRNVYSLAAGTYTLEWCYTKDASVDGGNDRAWIDLVTVTQDSPIITEVIPIPTPTNDNTPDYTFNTPIAGDISYSGSCSSSTHTGAVIGDNTITFDSLADGIYTDCTIQILASPQNSTILNVSNFTVDTTGIDITINNPLDSSTIGFSDFILDVSYSDAESGVNTGSIIVEMFKWNGSSYGSDIATTYIDFTGATITASGALYDIINPGEGQYKITFSIEDGIGNPGIATTVFNIESGDSIPPTIIINHPFSEALLPNSDFNINISYSDTGSVNTGSIDLQIKRWEGTVWGADIAPTYVDFAGANITATGAIYPTTKLGFGKYQLYFYIEDTNANGTGTTIEFYTDEPEIIISNSSIDIGGIKSGADYFSPGELNITVKTVGAGFDVILNKSSPLLSGTVEITDWNGTDGVGFDQNPYTSTVNLINTNEIIATQAGSINIDGNKNTYIYSIKLGVNIKEEQAAGNYSGDIKFTLDLDY